MSPSIRDLTSHVRAEIFPIYKDNEVAVKLRMAEDFMHLVAEKMHAEKLRSEKCGNEVIDVYEGEVVILSVEELATAIRGAYQRGFDDYSKMMELIYKTT